VFVFIYVSISEMTYTVSSGTLNSTIPLFSFTLLRTWLWTQVSSVPDGAALSSLVPHHTISYMSISGIICRLHTLHFNGHFPGEPGLAGCPLNSPSPFIPGLCILLGQAKNFHVILNTIQPGLFRASSNSFNFPRYTTFDPVIIIYSFNMYIILTYFLIIKLTGSNPKRSSLFFFIQLNPKHHLIILISVRFSFNSCSTFIGQVSLPCIRQLFTQVAYTLPFGFNENHFPVRMGRYSRYFFQAYLTLAVTAESHPPSASNISPK